ncbi:DUF262 domain-containing protein [Sulfitobacter geojensis]|uniref:DUF262 domain-containing protein n=1 Tax=Sulfitobacter geojensis TaxID=1342299 RepID=UPI0024908335|nr:DUF262 domain-containing protein [Sulfitobacter geojensis]
MADKNQELTVRGEQVERIYISYLAKKYLVNRRYQRKLIWTLQEKQNFIDSIVNGFPIPIILLAEPKGRADNALELIDGLQRMNAITSFISNDYTVQEGYFDLNTFATTKDLLDRGELEQRQPLLPREKCLAIAAYPVPLSIYEFAESESVDEVFRRINSGGRQLSRQELRTAGSINAFAETVRKVSSGVRGDSSSTDVILLNSMKKISITNADLDYGISADTVFWIKNNILTKDQLRQSRDEELVADLIAYMVSNEPVASRAELFDDYFGAVSPLVGTRLERYDAVDNAVRMRTVELLEYDFTRTLDEITLTLAAAGKTLSELLFKNNNAGNPIPRYFQAVFLALHQLIVKENKVVSDRAGLITRLDDFGKNITIQEGGRWGADNRSAAVDAVVGVLQNYFEDNAAPDPAKVHWVSKLQNLLTNSKTEQSAYDFKQGFMTLTAEATFDDASFEKILKTCVGIANISPRHKGYVIVGVAETDATAARVEKIFGAKPLTYNGFYITGVEHEADFLKKNLDQLFQDVSDRVRSSNISEPLRSQIGTRIKTVRYFDKTLFVFEVEGQDEVSRFEEKFFERKGTQLIEVSPENLGPLFARFSK